MTTSCNVGYEICLLRIPRVDKLLVVEFVSPNVSPHHAVVFGAKKKSIAQTAITNPHQKPLSEHYNRFQQSERLGAAC